MRRCLYFYVWASAIAIEARSVSSGRPPNQESAERAGCSWRILWFWTVGGAATCQTERYKSAEREITLIGLQARLSVVHVWRQSQQWLVFNSLCVWHTVAMSQMEKPREAIACSDDVSFDQYQCYRSSYFSQIIKNIAHVGYWTFFCFRAYIFRISFTMWAII